MTGKNYCNHSLVRNAVPAELSVFNIACGCYTGHWVNTVPFNRLVYVLNAGIGNSRIISDTLQFDAAPGHWLLIPPGVKTLHEQYEDIRLVSFHFNLEKFPGVEYFSGCPCVSGFAPEYMEKAAVCMDENISSVQPFILQEMLWHFLALSAGRLKDELESAAVQFVQFQELNRFLQSQLNRNVSVSEMARFMKMSNESFIRSFTAAAGMPPKLFFNRMRAAAAAKELLASSANIGEIARKYNFSDEYYFSRFFKRMTGLPPSFYRKQNARLT